MDGCISVFDDDGLFICLFHQMDDESIIIVWQIIEHMIMMVEISWQKLCIPVFDSIWRQFGSGFRVFKEAFRGSVFFFFLKMWELQLKS